mgnify:CR=1 FL=1
MTDLTLVGLCGSLRAASYNRQLMVEAAGIFGGRFVEGSLRLPLFDEDLEAEGMPEEVDSHEAGSACWGVVDRHASCIDGAKRHERRRVGSSRCKPVRTGATRCNVVRRGCEPNRPLRRVAA